MVKNSALLVKRSAKAMFSERKHGFFDSLKAARKQPLDLYSNSCEKVVVKKGQID